MREDEIFDYWRSQALAHGESHAASWSDRPVIELEIRAMIARLDDGDRVLDVGCANGFSTVRVAAARDVTVRGVDYVPEMIEQAAAALARGPEELRSRVSFDVGDVTRLSEPSDHYDKVIVTRVIINLGERPRQLQGLQEAMRVLRPGGTLLLSEAWLQGWRALNRFRAEWGLEPIPMPPFNNYLDQQEVEEALRPQAELLERVDFASSYYVGTRVFKPLVARLAGVEAIVADPESELNRWCSMLAPAGDYGTQALMVFRKRG